MTFDLQSHNIVHQLIQAADPSNFKFSELYHLYTLNESYNITDSIRTLTIFAISAAPANLYSDLFKGWKVASKSPLTFYRSESTVVQFFADWTIHARIGLKDEAVFEVGKMDTFKSLIDYLK